MTKHYSWKMFWVTLIIGLAIFYLQPEAHAQAQPIIKNGSCPSGYRKDGNYCVPRGIGDNSPQAIEKKGKCPSGWRSEGKYCIKRGS